MKITPNIEIIDCGIYFSKQNLLAFGDVHIGYEEALNKQGIFVPRFAFKEIMEKTEAMILSCLKKMKKKNLDHILINGDLKHEFGTISETEWRHTVRFLKLLQLYTSHIILIKGNHDTILAPLAKTKGLEVLDSYILDEVLFIHGDTIPAVVSDKKIKTIIIGHEHPAVTISQWPRTEKYKAMLFGGWKKKNLIVLPSLNPATEGTDILKESLLSPFLLGRNLSTFACYIIGDKTYYFGLLGNLKRRLLE